MTPFRSLYFVTAIATVTLGLTAARVAAQPSLPDAMAALRSGDAARAAEIATEWLEHQGDSAGHAHWVRGKAREELGDFAGAIDDYRFVTRVVPNEPGVLLALGAASFKNAEMERSISAFDSAARLDRGLEARLWQRGIAHYYARQFTDGARQFEIHRTVNPEDVENSVWHFLCVAASDGAEAARSGLIPVSHDRRSPMMEIQSLFRGESDPRRFWMRRKTQAATNKLHRPCSMRTSTWASTTRRLANRQCRLNILGKRLDSTCRTTTCGRSPGSIGNCVQTQSD